MLTKSQREQLDDDNQDQFEKSCDRWDFIKRIEEREEEDYDHFERYGKKNCRTIDRT
jgi:hypothetical protein